MGILQSAASSFQQSNTFGTILTVWRDSEHAELKRCRFPLGSPLEPAGILVSHPKPRVQVQITTNPLHCILISAVQNRVNPQDLKCRKPTLKSSHLTFAELKNWPKLGQSADQALVTKPLSRLTNKPKPTDEELEHVLERVRLGDLRSRAGGLDA